MNEELLYVLIGGGLGSVCRYLISEWSNYSYNGQFPLGTFIANVLGCLVIGIFVAILQPSGTLDLLLVTGFCGGFTTFSSFSKETFLLLKNKEIKLAILYSTLSPILGILAVFIGYTISGGNLS